MGSIYGFFCGGRIAGSDINVIQYITLLTTTQDAVDRGDLTLSRDHLTGASGGIYGFCAGGEPNRNTIDYIDLSLTVGNAADKGDLTVARQAPSGV